MVLQYVGNPKWCTYKDREYLKLMYMQKIKGKMRVRGTRKCSNFKYRQEFAGTAIIADVLLTQYSLQLNKDGVSYIDKN